MIQRDSIATCTSNHTGLAHRLRWAGAALAVTALLAHPALPVTDSGAAHGQSTASDAADPIQEAAPPARSDLEDLVENYSADYGGLQRRYELPTEGQRDRVDGFLDEWDQRLDQVDFDALGVEGRIDYHLLRNRLAYEGRQLQIEADRLEEMAPLVPFLDDVSALHQAHRDLDPVAPQDAAQTLEEARRELRATREEVQEALNEEEDGELTDPVVARRAFLHLQDLGTRLDDWFEFNDGYDPQFGWWVRTPWEDFEAALDDYIEFLRQDVVGMDPDADPDEEPIVGEPLGREALEVDLESELIPHSPEEILELAWEELEWGEAAMDEAAAELGYDDRYEALEHVKGLHVDPGDQPNLVVELAREAEEFLIERDLVTVPELAREIWRMEMLSPEWQRTAPFFLGGEVVRVAFPAEEMGHEDKLMSLRANNEHFSRAVVHHELIPGHHLQGFMTSRYQTHRSAFATPFWGEGWALYWEMLLWDLDFPRGPEDEMGMLFWRNHRAARIIFSLEYHMGEMSADEAVDFLVERVGHEPSTARAEVSRSFSGDYSPLYQMAYMWGGLQLRQLHRDLVEDGDMTDREFHDHILRSGRIPIEMVRASILETELPRDWEPDWRFEEDG